MKFALFVLFILIALSENVEAQDYQVEWSFRLDNAVSGYGWFQGGEYPLSDFDGDGNTDFVLITSNGNGQSRCTIISGSTHQELFHINNSSPSSSPTNLDDDPEPEFILIGDNSFEVRSGVTGTVEWRSPAINGITVYTYFADCDNDDRMEFSIIANVDGASTVFIYGFPGRGNRAPLGGISLPQNQSALTSGPNPFNGNTSIRFVSSIQTVGDIALIDIAGREIACRRNYPIHNGENIIPLSSVMPFYAGLPAGSYILRMNANNRIEAINVTKLP